MESNNCVSFLSSSATTVRSVLIHVWFEQFLQWCFSQNVCVQHFWYFVKRPNLIKIVFQSPCKTWMFFEIECESWNVYAKLFSSFQPRSIDIVVEHFEPRNHTLLKCILFISLLDGNYCVVIIVTCPSLNVLRDIYKVAPRFQNQMSLNIHVGFVKAVLFRHVILWS